MPLIAMIYAIGFASTAMEPREELEQLMTRQETLKRELKARKKELQDAQRRQRADDLVMNASPK